jgi:hypothetical protein
VTTLPSPWTPNSTELQILLEFPVERLRVEYFSNPRLLSEASSVDEVKSLSPHHRCVIALHLPGGVDETGLPQSPSEKKPRKLAREIKRDIFSGPVLARKLWYCGDFQRFSEGCSLVSLQRRLSGGESGIRNPSEASTKGLNRARSATLVHVSA